MEFRTLVALAATMAWGAVAAHATSGVQTARELRPALLPASLDDPVGTTPESPLGVAASLASDEPALQIQLENPETEPPTAALLSLPLETAPE